LLLDKNTVQNVADSFLIRSPVRLLFTFCTLRGPRGGLPYVYMYTATHEVFSFGLF